MKRDLIDLASSLTRRGVSFVMATVVRCEGATLAHLGDMALVTGDGAFHGWIGSAEIRAMIERESMRALAERKPCLICLSTSPEQGARPGVLQLQLPRDSEGALEVYLAPVVSAPRLLLIGRSPILTALATLARAIGYRIDRIVPEPRPEDGTSVDRVFRDCNDPRLLESEGLPVLAVIAPADEGDVDRIAAAMQISPIYLGVLASRRRFTLLRDALANRGLTAAVDRITNPTGLALGAHDPGEVAVGILAQMIARRNGVLAVNEASVTLNEASEVTSTMEVVVDPDAAREPAAERPAPSDVPISSPVGAPIHGSSDTPVSAPVDASIGGPMTTAASTTPGGTAAATASCFPVPVPESDTPATVSLRVRASSPALETRIPAAVGTPPTSRPPIAPDGTLPPGATTPLPSDGTPVPVGMVEALDPVCQTSVVIADALHVCRWQGRTWYFCSADCRIKFLANPLRYSAFSAEAPERT